MKFTTNIVFFVLLSFAIQAQQIEVNTFSNQNANPNFLAGSATFMYGLVQGNFNDEIGMYDSTFFGEGAVDLIADLNLNTLRFPGGTLSQYYHFRGANGYGTVANDLFCRPNFLPSQGFYTRVSNDYLYPQNMIYSYVDLIHELEEKQGKTVGTHYVLNLMTHYFTGDFFDINPYVDELINTYGADIENLLDLNPADLSEENIDEVVAVLLQVKDDPIIESLKQYLANQPSFYANFSENLEGIQFLIDNGLTIRGVEMGNESYSYKMLQDDDLSHVPFDCTTPDSVLVEYANYFIPVREYMQALVKYGMLCEMYNTAIKDFWNLETGIVINGTDFLVKTIELDVFEISTYGGEKGKFNEMWNKYIGQLDFPDAVIPHLYHKSIPECEIFSELSEDSISTFIRNRINFYFDDVLPWQLDNLKEVTRGKKMWVTEWNINGAYGFANTFAHANHTYKFLNTITALKEKYNIEHINFHSTIAWNFNQFALIRASRSSTDEYIVNKQSMYHSFDLMEPSFDASLAIADSDFSNWPLNNADTSTINYWGYYNADNVSYHLHFVNSTNEALEFNVDNLVFQIFEDSVWQDSLVAESFYLQYLDAESMFSSNDGCRDYPEIFDDNIDKYETDLTQIEIETSNKITLPPFTLGSVNFQLGEVVISDVAEQFNYSLDVYPNPASELLHLTIEQPKSALTAELFDEMGRINISENISQQQTAINISNLSNGIYFLQLKDRYGNLQGRKKIIVSHK